MAMSNLPLVVLLPFVGWLFLNTLLKRFVPTWSLTTIELRTVFSVLWVGGAFAGYNWATQWVGVMAAPRYYASPENRWSDLIFDYLPWWMYPTDRPGVIEGFYLGLDEGQVVPWSAWLMPLVWIGSVAVAMTAISIALTAIFQKQWAQHERLTFPVAQVPIALTEGFDRTPGWVPYVRSATFWIGFGVAALPLLWNIVEYFYSSFPRIPIFDPYYGPNGPRGSLVSRYLPAQSYRLLPTVLGVAFLCELNILFSIWSLYLVGLVAQYGMTRVGFSIGLTGQEAKPPDIIGLFIHGVMIGLAIWSVWTARGHLANVWREARRGKSVSTAIVTPRTALWLLIGGSLFLIFWLSAVGYSLILAASWVILFWTSLFLIMKFLAASGFAYLFPNWGTSIPVIWAGTSRMSEATLVASRVVNWRLLAGWRLPVALPHVARLLGARLKARTIYSAVLLGLAIAGLYTVWLCYLDGGATFRTWSLVGAPRGVYNGIAKAVSETSARTVTDPAKIFVWFLGIGAAALTTILQARASWWPFHPVGLLLMFDGYVRLYVLDIFLIWGAKAAILRLGGITLYERVKPGVYGLIVGYAAAVGLSFLVDLIWFPTGGHYIHGY
ncbi:MAG: hypothetical protein CME19_12400 [Gemmatimonadetes bacterium]|nr:hypothetical protein [Gemmatimonadota bacterium]